MTGSDSVINLSWGRSSRELQRNVIVEKSHHNPLQQAISQLVMSTLVLWRMCCEANQQCRVDAMLIKLTFRPC